MLGCCTELTRSSLGKDLSASQMLSPGEWHKQFCITNTSLSCGIYARTQIRQKCICLLVHDKLFAPSQKRLVQRGEGEVVFSFPLEFVTRTEKENHSNVHGRTVLIYHQYQMKPETTWKSCSKVRLKSGDDTVCFSEVFLTSCAPQLQVLWKN